MHIPALALALALDFAVAAAAVCFSSCLFLVWCYLFCPQPVVFSTVLSGPLLTRFTGF